MNIVEAIIRIIPMAVVMVTGPQIVTAVVLVALPDRGKQTARFIAGGMLGICLVVGITYATGFTLSSSLQLPDLAKWVISLALAGAMVSAFARRNRTQQDSSGSRRRGSFLAGLFLMSLFPTDLLTNVGVAATLNDVDKPLVGFALFLGVTVLFLAIPFLLVTILGQRADPILEAFRELIAKYSWILTEIICLALIVSVWT